MARADETPAQNKIIVNSPDDRLSTVPAKWWTYSHQTSQDVSNTVSNQNGRIVDISVEQTAPALTFTVTYVQNAGPYYKAWLWYPGIDPASLAAAIAKNNVRLTVLKPVDAGGGQFLFLAVLILNGGKDTTNSWYYTDTTADQITSALAANNARLTQLSSYVSAGKTHLAAVMVAKSANDPGSWWYTDMPAAQIGPLLSTNNARLVDIEYIPSDGNYNAIMVGCGAGCPAWSWYTGQTLDQMQGQAAQNSERIVNSVPYSGCGGLCYSYIVEDNSLPSLNGANPITTRVAALLQAGGIDGVQGLYLKQVGGPVLANLEESFVYEPASSIKVLAHLYAMTQVQNGTANLTDSVQQYTNGPTSCPDPAQLGGTENLSTALQEMMWHSDNARTREITDKFGDSNINPFGVSIGMQNTSINHIIGCAGPIPDQLTLTDAGVLYEGVANGTLLSPASRTTFAGLMAGKGEFQVEGYDFTHLWDTDLPAMIAQAAPSATAQQRQSYLNQMNLAYKAGSYEICDASCTNVGEYYAISGWVEIPFCSGGAPALQDYVFGLFLHGGTDSSWVSGKNTLTVQNFNAAKSELLREQIAAGLASCGMGQ
jgi:hypothetical protein